MLLRGHPLPEEKHKNKIESPSRKPSNLVSDAWITPAVPPAYKQTSSLGQQGMAKITAAAAAVLESRSLRGARAVRLLHRIHHRFLLLLGATAPKAGRRKVARSREPKSLRAADEKQEQDVEAQDPNAAAAVSASDSASEAAVAGKYWAHRYSLFNLYDRGVCMDAEGWYSATPESIAALQAARAAPGDLVVDAFAGCGGNSIQFAARGCYVVAVEIDPRKVELAVHNARVYGVEDRIEFIVGDFFRLAPFLKADLVFLSPPWGGPSYIEAPVYTLDMLKPKDGYATFQAAQKIAPNVMMFLPRTVDVAQLEELSWMSCPPLDFETEENYVQHRCKGITAYFGRRYLRTRIREGEAQKIRRLTQRRSCEAGKLRHVCRKGNRLEDEKAI
uniref:Trimethylguanosine synthase n=2 Tax=Zea mays TaxID=4577 RepID=A0A804R2D1_MAIZE